jgi:hypothetical protein
LDILVCLERVPHKLAAWAEGCECHQPFAEHLSAYMQRKRFKCHYGAGLCTCPMRGKRAPELANGKSVLSFAGFVEGMFWQSSWQCPHMVRRPSLRNPWVILCPTLNVAGPI